MRQGWQRGLKVIARSSLTLVRTLVVFTVGGTLLSWAALLLVRPQVNQLCGGAATGFFEPCAASISLWLLYLVGVPLACFFLAKLYGVQRVLARHIHELKGPLAVLITRHAFAFLDKHNLNLASLSRDERSAALARFLQSLSGLSLPMRWIARAFLGRFNYLGALDLALDAPDASADREELLAHVAAHVEAQLDERLPADPPLLFYALLGLVVVGSLALRFGVG